MLSMPHKLSLSPKTFLLSAIVIFGVVTLVQGLAIMLRAFSQPLGIPA